MKLKTNIGVYVLWCNDEAVYIGKSIKIKTRIYQSIKARETESIKISDYSIIETGSNFEACSLEKMLILENRPLLNQEMYEKCFCNVIKSNIDLNKLEKFNVDEELVTEIDEKLISIDVKPRRIVGQLSNQESIIEDKNNLEYQEMILKYKLYNLKNVKNISIFDVEIISRFIEEYIDTAKLLFKETCICEDNIDFSKLLLYLEYIIKNKEGGFHQLILDMKYWLFDWCDSSIYGSADISNCTKIERYLTDELNSIDFYYSVDIYNKTKTTEKEILDEINKHMSLENFK